MQLERMNVRWWAGFIGKTRCEKKKGKSPDGSVGRATAGGARNRGDREATGLGDEVALGDGETGGGDGGADEGGVNPAGNEYRQRRRRENNARQHRRRAHKPS